MNKRYAVLAAVILLAAGALRLAQVGQRSLSHPEMFVPRLPLPVGLSEPPPRFELIPLIRDVVAIDTHPPGYYALMWFLMRVFGADTWSMRLPSVVFGVATVGVLIWLGVLLKQPRVGLLAAALLAFNGYHVFWSQVARMYALEALLAVLATAMLLIATRRILWLYGTLTIFGLSVHVYFWGVLAAHMVWVAVRHGRNGVAPPLLGVQVLLATLGSPLLAVAAYQSANPVSSLFREVWLLGGEALQFGFLLPRSAGPVDVYLPSWDDALQQANPYSPGWFGFLLVSLYLLFAAARTRHSESPGMPSAVSWLRPIWFVAAATLACTADAALLLAAAEVAPKAPSAMLATRIATGVPWAMLLVALVLPAVWRRLGTYLQFGDSTATSLVFMTGFVPLILLGAFSLLLRPVLTPRGLIIFVPFVLYALALGMVEAARGRKVLAVGLAMLLVPLHLWSLEAYSERGVDPLDYRQLAAQITPQVNPRDHLFYQVNWAHTPLLWYLRSFTPQIVADDFAQAVTKRPDGRVWLLRPYRMEPTPDMTAALTKHRLARVIRAENGSIELWEPVSP